MGCSLNDCLSFSNGKKYPNSKGNIPIYGGNGVLGYCEESNASNCIIIGRVGAYCGGVYYEKGKSWVSDNAIMGSAKEGFDIRFLYYLLLTLNLQKRQQGTSQPLLTQGLLKSINIPRLPEISTQRRVSSFLSLFDQKIELNNLVNDYLEELCDAIYQDFVNSNDESWRRGTLNELLDIKYGKDHKKLADGPYPVYGSGGYMRSVEKPLANGESVLIPRKGSLNNVMYVNEEFWTVDTMFFTVPRVPGAAKYAFQYIKKLDLESMNSGSAVPSMTTAILNALELPIPDHEALRELDKRFQPMYKLKAANKTEIEQLSALRDAILPKLMSGEIDVSNLDLTQLNNHLCDCLYVS